LTMAKPDFHAGPENRRSGLPNGNGIRSVNLGDAHSYEFMSASRLSIGRQSGALFSLKTEWPPLAKRKKRRDVYYWVVNGRRYEYAHEMETSSIFRPVVGLLLALATVACGSATTKKPTTIEEFIAQIDQLNGQTVMVTGYLGECGALSCILYRNKAESDDVDRAMSDIRAALEEGATDVSGFPFPDHPSVSIGPGSQSSFFDLRAYFYANGYVVITGEATSQCRSKGVACFDRVGDILPTSVRSAPAPS